MTPGFLCEIHPYDLNVSLKDYRYYYKIIEKRDHKHLSFLRKHYQHIDNASYSSHNKCCNHANTFTKILEYRSFA